MTTLPKFPTNVLKAAATFVQRKNRSENPEGKFDNAGRWYPAGRDAEVFDAAVRSPSRAWPYSYLVHARTAAHVARLYDADPKQVRKAAKLIEAEEAQND